MGWKKLFTGAQYRTLIKHSSIALTKVLKGLAFSHCHSGDSAVKYVHLEKRGRVFINP
jgi:hypothetical protein